MTRTVLFLALALAAGTALAEPAPTPAARPTPAPAPAAAAAPSARAAPAAQAQPTPARDTAAAREQLQEMREQMRELSRKMADLSARLGDTGPRSYAYRYIGDPERAMLGIVMWPDAKGVKIAGITPGGPAAKAGVKNGDIVLAIDGKAIVAHADDEGLAVAQATQAIANLKVGQEVSLRLAREGKTQEVKVKAERREALSWPRAFAFDSDGKLGTLEGDDVRVLVDSARAAEDAARGIDVEAIRRSAERQARTMARLSHADAERVARATRHLSWAGLRMPWWGLNLAALDKDLGVYFGTDRGALVLNADEQAFPGLKSGDVVQSVGGETVQDPEDAMRLLRDAPAGKDVSVKVLRQRKVVTIAVKSPEFKALFPPLPPAAPEPPQPPEPPAAPEPPAPPEPPVVG